MELWQHYLTRPDVLIGHQQGPRTCFCFAAGQGRRFNVHGAEGSRTDVGANPELEPIHGSWPKDSGAFDNTPLVYLKAKVYRCANRACASDADCGQWGYDDAETPLAAEQTSDYRIHIEDGEGFERGIELIFSIVSLVKGAFSAASSFGALLTRIDSVEERVARLERAQPSNEGDRTWDS